MERFLEWAWNRHGARYAWVLCAIAFVVALPIYLALSVAIVAVEQSSRYLATAGATGVVVLVMAYLLNMPHLRVWRLVEQGIEGSQLDRAGAMEATYADSSRGRHEHR